MNWRLVFFLFCGLHGAVAQLFFEQTTHAFVCDPLQAEELVSFAFQNRRSKAVRIVSVTPDCGCISGSVNEELIPAGGKGEVKVVFDLSQRQGSQRKSVTLKTECGQEQQLFVSTQIPVSFVPSVRRLVWEQTEERNAKTFRFENRHSSPLFLERATVAKEGLAVKLRTVKEGVVYEVEVTPDSATPRGLFSVVVHPELPAGMDEGRTFKVYALLK